MKSLEVGQLEKEHRDTLRKLLMAIRLSGQTSLHRARLAARQFLNNGCAGDGIRPLIAALDRDSFTNAERELERAERFGVHVVSIFDECYPADLRSIPDPPLVLFLRGKLIQRATVAIVGMRRASKYGLQIAEQYAGALAERGVVVASGLAYGIDAAAHRGAIAGSKCRTDEAHPGVAVLGSGVLNVTPAAHRALAEDLVANGGALISEYGLDEPAAKRHFPERNRVISGMSDAVIVVEAEERSGSLITARCAAEQGRDVLAVPGPLGAPSSSGTNRLLRDGATMLLELADVIGSLPKQKLSSLRLERRDVDKHAQTSEAPASQTTTQPKRTVEEETVLNLLDHTTLYDFDSLLEKTGFSTPQLLAILGGLELSGAVLCHDGGLYLRNQMVDMQL
ncbi:MAG: DNA-processing protein DprA [Bdellovibrionota bacterium]